MSDRSTAATRRIALLLEYDGTDFSGSQVQPGVRTVQQTLETALAEFTGEAQRVAFAGRTDAGVHAWGQVAALNTARTYNVATFRDALCHFLPEDVAVRQAIDVKPDFDPRRHAVSRWYRYRMEEVAVRSPLGRRTGWQLTSPLDSEAMSAAVALLPRTETDWAAFAGPVPDGYPTVRTLQSCSVTRVGECVTMDVEADGFLPHQVRRMVGALRAVGSHKLTPTEFAELVDGPAGSAGPTAPPQGLTLVHVRYPHGTVEWDER